MPRVRALGVALLVALALMFATRTLRVDGWYAAHAGYRAQVDALLDGRLALATIPDGLAHDLAWTGDTVQQVWGLGVPLWQLPFEAVGRLVGVSPFPDRVPMLVWLVLVVFMMLRAWRARTNEPWWIGAGSVVITALLPAVIAMMRGRIDVYDEAALYAYGAAMILLGGLACFAHQPSRARYLLLLAAAGAVGLIRPTVWFYGLATAIVATAIWLRDRRDLLAVAIGALLFVAGGAALWTTNRVRFGSGTEFGHRINLASLPGNLVATRFSYPFERVGTIEAAEEEVGALFDRPETRISGHGFYQKDLHHGQSDEPRWREYYFSTFSWPYLPLLVAGLVLGLRAWRRHERGGRWLVAWAVLGGTPLGVFYLHSPSMSSRYELDLAPGFAALLVIAWQAGASWLHDRRRGLVAVVALAGLWTAAVVTSRYYRPRIGSEPVDRATAAASTYTISRPVAVPHPLPSSYNLADPKLPPYLTGDHFDRCTDRDGASADCDRDARLGDHRVHGVRTTGAWQLTSSTIVDDPPTCMPDELACLGLPTIATAAAHSDSTTSTTPLYLNGFGWNLDTGAVPPATYFFVDDPRFIELDVDGDGDVRVAIGLQHLHLVSTTSTGTRRHLRFEADDLPRRLAVCFVAFGSDEHLDQPTSAMSLLGIRWRE